MPHVEYLLPWPHRPLRCLLGLHQWHRHPADRRFRYCRLCGAETRDR